LSGIISITPEMCTAIASADSQYQAHSYASLDIGQIRTHVLQPSANVNQLNGRVRSATIKLGMRHGDTTSEAATSALAASGSAKTRCIETGVPLSEYKERANAVLKESQPASKAPGRLVYSVHNNRIPHRPARLY
jgi:hypothetical protein